jgi:hypothetical protein
MLVSSRKEAPLDARLETTNLLAQRGDNRKDGVIIRQVQFVFERMPLLTKAQDPIEVDFPIVVWAFWPPEKNEGYPCSAKMIYRVTPTEGYGR